MAKKVVKRGRPKGSKNKVKQHTAVVISNEPVKLVKESEPLPGEVMVDDFKPDLTQNLKVPTASDKQYIYDNYSKKSTDELSKETGLTVGQIQKLVLSTELDEAPSKTKKPRKLRRFDVKSPGTVTMTESMAMLGDKARENGQVLTEAERIKAKYGKDVEIIKSKFDGLPTESVE